MKLNDKSVLEPLQFEAADLSSGWRFLNHASGEPEEQDAPRTTGAVLETRGIISQAGTPPTLDAHEKNDASAPTYGTFNRLDDESRMKPQVVWVPVMPLSLEGFDVLQRFEGTVVSATDDSLIARLVDKTKCGPEEEAEIPLAEVMPGDRELVRPGAMFYWVIGYRREAHGQLSRSSTIRFQRLPAWSPADIERAKKEAETFLSFLDLERANKPS